MSEALQRNFGATNKAVERWHAEMPREEEMVPKDKYTIFDRKEKKYRKGIHSGFPLLHLAVVYLLSSFEKQGDGMEQRTNQISLL